MVRSKKIVVIIPLLLLCLIYIYYKFVIEVPDRAPIDKAVKDGKLILAPYTRVIIVNASDWPSAASKKKTDI